MCVWMRQSIVAFVFYLSQNKKPCIGAEEAWGCGYGSDGDLEFR